jgi:hypothetical protein
MDPQVANELVAMRHEELSHSRHAGHGHPQVRPATRRVRLTNIRQRLAMWAFGPGVMVPRTRARHAR